MKDTNEIYKKFFDSIITSDIKNIVEVAYEYFERPIIVIDVSYRLICQLPNKLVSDTVFDSILIDGEMPQETVRFLEEGKYRTYLENNPQASYVDWGNLIFPRVMGAIKDGQRIVGYFAVLYKENDYNVEDLKIAEVFRQALGILMTKKGFYNIRKDELTSFFMRELLDGNIKTSEALSEWSKYLPYINQGGYLILNARKVDEDLGTSLVYACRRVGEEFRDCYSIIKDGDMYVLFYNLGKLDKETSIKKGNVYNVTRFLESCNIKSGLSNIFYNIEKIEDSIYMAKEALSFGSKFSLSKNVYEFKDYVFNCMIEKISDTPRHSIYIHPSLEKLIQYDVEYKTDFVSTLKEYIIAFKDLTTTAEKLKIHRNSLKYRLQRISDVCNIDFSDKLVCAQLLCNFYMIDNLESNQ